MPILIDLDQLGNDDGWDLGALAYCQSFTNRPRERRLLPFRTWTEINILNYTELYEEDGPGLESLRSASEFAG